MWAAGEDMPSDIAGRLFSRAVHEISGGPEPAGPDQPGQIVTAPLVVRSSA
jgi:hypothetical protein